MQKLRKMQVQFSHTAYNDTEEHFNESPQNEEVAKKNQMMTMNLKNVCFAMN